MQPAQVGSRLAHRLEVKVVVVPAELTVIQAGPLGTVEQQVGVRPATRPVAGVKSVIDLARPGDGYGSGQQRVHAAHPGGERTPHLGIEMHDLAERVHARVGAPGTLGLDPLVGDLRQTDPIWTGSMRSLA